MAESEGGAARGKGTEISLENYVETLAGEL